MLLGYRANRRLEGKSPENKRRSPRIDMTAGSAIVLCQHVLLWSSLFVISGTAYVLSEASLATDALVSESFLLASGSIAMVYLLLHNISAIAISRRTNQPNDNRTVLFQKIATHLLRFSFTAWMLSFGIAITFIMARHPLCNDGMTGSPLDIGSTCVIQRTTVGASLLALVISGVLIVLMHRTREPSQCHLFGVLQETPLLPLMLPYKTSIDRAKPVFSEMSFKCRSSTALSSRTLVPSFDELRTSLLPKQPEKAIGLEIYAPRSAIPSFLGPRPSLSSIRSYASIHVTPPHSPLPPLPAYFPEKYRRGSAMHQGIHPPQRPQHPARRPNERTVRIVSPLPALSVANLEAFNKSAESLSSVYSRSISGERHSPRLPRRPGALTADSRSFNSSSTATVKKSPLDVMRLASDPDIIVGTEQGDGRRTSSADSDSDIDDAAALQARLPSFRAVSDFGEVLSW